MVELVTLNARAAPKLRSLGFVPTRRHDQLRFMLSVSETDPVRPRVADPANWFVTSGDGDLEFVDSSTSGAVTVESRERSTQFDRPWRHAERMIPGTLSEQLGHSAVDKLLIVKCDDLGSSPEANRAISEAFDRGTATSASLMVPCRAARAAVESCRAKDIGVHLTLNCEIPERPWGPLTDGRSFLDDNGRLTPHPLNFIGGVDAREVRVECRAQIDQALAWGVDVTHLDSHRNALVYRKDLAGVHIRSWQSNTTFRYAHSRVAARLEVGRPSHRKVAVRGAGRTSGRACWRRLPGSACSSFRWAVARSWSRCSALALRRQRGMPPPGAGLGRAPGGRPGVGVSRRRLRAALPGRARSYARRGGRRRPHRLSRASRPPAFACRQSVVDARCAELRRLVPISPTNG